jgi:hypothetical protein
MSKQRLIRFVLGAIAAGLPAWMFDTESSPPDRERCGDG